MNTDTLTNEVIQLHADICLGLADPRRILMLYAVSESPRTVGDLVRELGISQPAVSRHLKILRDRGMVNASRQGANVVYNITDHRLIEALDTLRDVLRDRIVYHASLIDVSK
ncbi:MAG: winged helix-turn-helix transcriptional regulator [Anaerolineales bacterium]|nr:winged helix-turn-helix transcriptional regulator [Anaerolineales bacterium]